MTEQAEQQVRSVNVSRVRPVIQGIEVLRMPRADGSGDGAVVVVVPPSPDSPHFVERRESTVAPWRNGPHTEVLQERQIERAYADRFARRTAAAANLQHLVESTRASLSYDEVWMLGVAHPRVERDVTLRVPARDEATAAVLESMRLGLATLHHGLEEGDPRKRRTGPSFGSPFAAVGDAVQNPRRGLRRWVIRPDSTELSRTGVTTTTYAELHESGAVVLAVPCWVTRELEAAHQGESLVQVAIVEYSAVALVALAAAWADKSGGFGTVSLRLDVVPRDRDIASMLRIVSQHDYGQGFTLPEVPEWTVGRPRVVPAEAELLDPQDPGDRRLTAKQLTEDVVHQFGLTTLESLA